MTDWAGEVPHGTRFRQQQLQKPTRAERDFLETAKRIEQGEKNR